MSEIAFQSFKSTVPKHIINVLKKTQKAFLREMSAPNIKHATPCNKYHYYYYYYYYYYYNSSMLLDKRAIQSFYT